MKIRIGIMLLLLAVLGTAFTGCNEKEEKDNLELVWELESDKGQDTSEGEEREQGFPALLRLVSMEGRPEQRGAEGTSGDPGDPDPRRGPGAGKLYFLRMQESGDFGNDRFCENYWGRFFYRLRSPAETSCAYGIGRDLLYPGCGQ